MAAFLIGICVAGLVAAITFVGYEKYDVSSGRAGERSSVKLEDSDSFPPMAQKISEIDGRPERQ